MHKVLIVSRTGPFQNPAFECAPFKLFLAKDVMEPVRTAVHSRQLPHCPGFTHAARALKLCLHCLSRLTNVKGRRHRPPTVLQESGEALNFNTSPSFCDPDQTLSVRSLGIPVSCGRVVSGSKQIAVHSELKLERNKNIVKLYITLKADRLM